MWVKIPEANESKEKGPKGPFSISVAVNRDCTTNCTISRQPSSSFRRYRQAQDAAGVFQRRLGRACLSEYLQKVAEDLLGDGSAGGSHGVGSRIQDMNTDHSCAA